MIGERGMIKFYKCTVCNRIITFETTMIQNNHIQRCVGWGSNFAGGVASGVFEEI